MEYTKQQLQLQLRIEVIKELKIHPGDKIKHKARDNFIAALYEASRFSETMKDKEQVLFLQGINQALGNEASIASWIDNPPIFGNACDRLHKFIHENYPPDPTPANSLRLRAFAALIGRAFAFLFLLAVAAVFTFYAIVVSPSMPVLPIVLAAVGITLLTLLGEMLLDKINSLCGFQKSDSLQDVLLYGEKRQDCVTNNLVNGMSFFAPAKLSKHEHYNFRNTQAVEPVYIQTRVAELAEKPLSPLGTTLEPVYIGHVR